MKKFLLLLLILFAAVQLNAQWVSNVNINTIITDTTGDKAVPKIAPATDGGCYISWFDNRGGSYAVYLQRLDANGVRQFPMHGLLISSNPQSSSLVDWDMTVDAGNNAILAFTDTRNGSSINPFAYKISPAGTFLWGANGVTLTDSSAVYQANPKVAATTDGNYVFCWIYASTPRKIAMQKLNSSGVPQWGSVPVKLSGSGSENLDWPALIKSDSGSVIMLWSGYTGSFMNPQNYKLYTQKFSPANTRLWTNPQDTVYNLGRVNGFYTPRLFTDGVNGALYCWRDDRNSLNIQGAYAQRFNSAGIRQFQMNGAVCSDLTNFHHFDPVGTYVPSTGETYVFWSDANSGQTQVGGLNGQRFNSTGVPQWTTSGKTFKAIDNNQFNSLNVLAKDTNVIVSFNETQYGSNNNIEKIMKTGPSGVFHWTGNILVASNITGSKSRLGMVTRQSDGMGILAWQESRNGVNIFAQNVNFNGTFGPPTGIIGTGSTAPEKFSLSQNYPNPFNPSTKIKFKIPSSEGYGFSRGVGLVTLKVFDITGREVRTLINESLNPGTYEVTFDGSNLNSGVYFYKIQAGEFLQTKKLIILK